VPNQLGVDFNARILESIVRDIRPHLGGRVAAEGGVSRPTNVEP
jgi:hypothetical protein